jgi:hypothetical protein
MFPALIALRPGRLLGRITLPTGTAGPPERRADSLGHKLRAELLELEQGAQPGLDLADGQRDPRRPAEPRLCRWPRIVQGDIRGSNDHIGTTVRGCRPALWRRHLHAMVRPWVND